MLRQRSFSDWKSRGRDQDLPVELQARDAHLAGGREIRELRRAG